MINQTVIIFNFTIAQTLSASLIFFWHTMCNAQLQKQPLTSSLEKKKIWTHNYLIIDILPA